MTTTFAAYAHPLSSAHTKLIQLIEVVRAMFVTSAENARPALRHYPPNLNYLFEDSGMAREMRRL